MAEINKEDLFSEEALNAPKELAASLGIVAKGIDSITKASRESEKVLKTAGSSATINKNVEQLTTQEKELIKVQKQLSVALAKNNDEYIEYKRGVDAVNRSVKEKINKGREDLTFTGQMKNAMKDLKEELKAARNEMLLAADAGGTMSTEYQEAAKKAGEIADKIGDAKDEAKAFQGDTAIENLGTRFGMLGSKIGALDFKGAGEQIKGISAISKTMTFKETIGGVGDFGKSLGTLAKTILLNPLFILVGVLTGIGVAVYALRDKVGFLRDAFSAVGDALSWIVQQGKDFLDWTGASTFAADELSQTITDNAKKEQDAITKRYDKEIALASAAGKNTESLEIKKQQAILATSTEALKAFEEEKQRAGKLSDERQKLYDEEVKTAEDAQFQIELIQTKAHEEQKKRAAELRALRVKELDELGAKVAEEQFAAEQKRINEETELLALAEHIANKKFEEENLAEYLIGLEQEKTDNFMTLSELREKRLAEETAAQTQFVNGLMSFIVAAANSNDNKLRNLAKGFTIFMLDQLEKQLLATQAATIAKATAEAISTPDSALTFGATGISRAIILTALIKGAFAVAKNTIGKFEKGTDNAPGGLAFVGEAGRELIMTPAGQTMLSPDSATLMNLPKGSRVIPNEETMRILAANSLINQQGGVSSDYIIASKLNQLNKTIQETNGEVVKAIVENATDYAAQASLLLRVKKKVDGSKQITHSRAMGY